MAKKRGAAFPYTAPTQRELADMFDQLCSMMCPPNSDPPSLDRELHWRLINLLGWQLWGKQDSRWGREHMFLPSAFRTQDAIDLVRAGLVHDGCRTVGWKKAPDWAAKMIEFMGEPYAGSPRMMLDAYKRMKRFWPRLLTYRLHPSRVVLPEPVTRASRPKKPTGHRRLSELLQHDRAHRTPPPIRLAGPKTRY